MSFGFSQSRTSNSLDGDAEQMGISGIPAGIETGAILRERREAMGVTLEEAEASIRIRQKYLAAMEADEWHLLPGEIVGRGFLRNYAAYLDLEPEEMLERRRSVIEPRLAAALRSTSAGSALPPVREVNYNPKELELKDEPEGIEGTPFNFRGLLPILALLLFAYLVWQSFDFLTGVAGTISEGVQARIEAFRESAASAESDGAAVVEGVAGAETDSGPSAAGGDGAVDSDSDNSSGAGEASNNGSNGGTGSGDGSGTGTDSGAEQATSGGEQELPAPTPEPPTPTPEPPTPEPPTATPVPPTPVPPTPIPEPPTPVPEPPTPEPVVVAPTCPDARSIITSPGQNQTISGPFDVSGSAVHEAFQFYKLEYAPGANADGGWAYFDGANNPVSQGRLGRLDTASLANGVYTMRLVVVDLSANFPPPCQVTFTIQN